MYSHLVCDLSYVLPCIAFEYDRHIGSGATEVPVKIQSDRTIPNINLAATRPHEIPLWSLAQL